MAWDDNYTAVPTRDTTDVNSFADVNQLQSNTGVLKGGLIDSSTKTADYTVTDTDGLHIIFVNPSTGDVTITLPTLADNQDRRIKIIVTDLGGKVTVDGEGAETIGGYSELVMQSKNDSIEIVGEAGEWQIIKYYAKYDTGWIYTTSTANRHLGTSAFDYDNRSSGGADHFTVGEVITEATSGNTGIIQSDTDAASSGTIYVKNMTGTGIWTNNRQITGSTSGTTADVNEASGSNQNQDTNFLHDFGITMVSIKKTFYWSTDKTEANTFEPAQYESNLGSFAGWTYYGIDTNNIKFQTGQWTNGFFYISDAGASVGAGTGYYKVILEVVI